MLYPSAANAINQFLENELSPTVMMRALLEYQDWQCLGQRNEEDIQPNCIVMEEGNGQCLVLFTDCAAQEQSEGSSLIPNNSQFFSLKRQEHLDLLKEIQGLWINPGLDSAIKLEGQQFKTYSELAQGLDVERCLAGLNEDPDFYKILRSYKHWYIILLDGESKLLLKPDSQGRQFAAAFSAWDAVEHAVADIVEGPYKNPAAIKMNGHELFTLLVGLDITGMVFNYAGPISSHVFDIDFAKEILESNG